jgi:SET domain-containing protein
MSERGASLGGIAVHTFPGKGRGVVAERAFAAGETIERPPVIALSAHETALIRETRLAHYYFEWGADCQQAAIALGYGSLYNHSYSPNARYAFHEDVDHLEIIAQRAIESGEEITINYNNIGPDAAKPLKFEVK